VRREARFPDTRWSLISDARATDDRTRERALSELCGLYWYPVYAFARSRGCSPPHAEDMTQDLFLKFLSRDSFRTAQKDKGKLRTYLLTSMTRLLANEARRAGAAKRSSEKFAVPIGREDAELRLAAEAQWTEAEAPDRQFDRRWAEAMLQEVEKRLEREHEASGKLEVFAALKPFIAGDGSGAGYAEVGESLGMSEGAVKVAVHRLRKRFRMVLSDEIAQTVSDPDEVEEELRHLCAALAGS
jgi:RNA polymerase sigma-70 factor (ECF subfamily)